MTGQVTLNGRHHVKPMHMLCGVWVTSINVPRGIVP